MMPESGPPIQMEEYQHNFSNGTPESLSDVITTEPSSSTPSPDSKVKIAIWKGMAPDDLFDLSIASDESKRNAATLLYGLTRIDFNVGNFRVFVANRTFEHDETSKNTEIEVVICEQRYLPSKLKRLTSYFRMKIWPIIHYRKVNETMYEMEKLNHGEGDSELLIDGSNYQCVMARKDYTIHTSDTSATYSDLLRHFFFIFPNQIPLFSLDLRGIRTFNFDIPAMILDSYEQCRLCPCLVFKIQNNEFVEQAHRILEKMENLTNLKVDIVAEGTEFFSPKMCQLNNLQVTYMNNSISEANLISLNCGTIKLWAVTIGATSLNKFIKRWLASTEKKLQYLEMPCMVLDEKDSDVNNIVKDLNIMKCDELRRAPIYNSFEWNYEFNCQGKQRFIKCHSGWDLERSDGVLATIVYEKNLFYFLVWYDRYPEQPVDHIRYLDADAE